MRPLSNGEAMRACSAARNQPTAGMAGALEARERATIRLPAESVYMDDWRRGKAGAQSGCGLRMGDNDPHRTNGGNCYACHQLTKAELSFGTLGPSLLGYGRQQGASPEGQRVVYEKIYNPHAAFPCSTMPRFGSNGVLTIEQIKDFVVLLLDPESPVTRWSGACQPRRRVVPGRISTPPGDDGSTAPEFPFPPLRSGRES